MERGTCLKITTSWVHKVQQGASVANGRSLKSVFVVLETQLWCTCQKGPSSRVILSVSQGSLCRGKLSLPACYWGHPRLAALGKIVRSKRKCIFSAFSQTFLSLSLLTPFRKPLEHSLHSHISRGASGPVLFLVGSLSLLFLTSPCPRSHSLLFIKTDISVYKAMKLIWWFKITCYREYGALLSIVVKNTS